MTSQPKEWEAGQWKSLGFPISKHPNATYDYPSKTEFDSNTGTYKAHPSYENDQAARDREAAGSEGRDHAYSTENPRHFDSRNHGPCINDQAARDREATNVLERDFAYPSEDPRHRNSKKHE